MCPGLGLISPLFMLRRWSPSFIFATAAMAFFLLATFYLLIDVFPVWNGSPFRFIGNHLPRSIT